MSRNRTATGRKLTSLMIIRRSSQAVRRRSAYLQPGAALSQNYTQISIGQNCGTASFLLAKSRYLPVASLIMGDDVLDWGHERRSMMKLLTLALGAVLFALAETFCECLGASRMGRGPLGECRLQDLAQRYQRPGWLRLAACCVCQHLGRSALEDGAALSNARLRIARTRR